MKRNLESGQSLVLVALAMVVLIGFLGFAIDFGYYRFLRRQLQTAADAAALAGAMDITYGDYAAAGQAAASGNGFTTGPNISVVMSNPPASGVFTGASHKNYVQAVVTESNVPTFFSKIFGGTAPVLSATAVAEGGLNCIYGLDQGAGALSLIFTAVNSACGVVDNDNLSLNLAALCAPSIQLIGNQTGVFGSTCSSGFARAKPVKITTPVLDPFCQTAGSCLPQPSPSALLPASSCTKGIYTVSTVVNPLVATITQTLTSGFCGINITAPGHTVTFTPGSYYGPINITNATVIFANSGGSGNTCGGSTYCINSSSQPGIKVASNNIFGGSTVSFQAGIHTVAGGISDTGSFGSNINFNSTSGSPSLIILDGGGLKLLGNAGNSGTAGQSSGGITFYNTGTAAGACVTCYGQIVSYFNFSGAFCGASCNLTAPTSGTYTGILFFQDRNDTSTAACPTFGGLFGSSNASACFGATLNLAGGVSHAGAYYFPSGTVSFYFNFGIGAPYTYLVAKDVSWFATFQFNTNYASLPTSFPLRQGSAVLVQ